LFSETWRNATISQREQGANIEYFYRGKYRVKTPKSCARIQNLSIKYQRFCLRTPFFHQAKIYRQPEILHQVLKPEIKVFSHLLIHVLLRYNPGICDNEMSESFVAVPGKEPVIPSSGLRLQVVSAQPITVENEKKYVVSLQQFRM